eukprot:3584487-Amphidinium_carterae.1
MAAKILHKCHSVFGLRMQSRGASRRGQHLIQQLLSAHLLLELELLLLLLLLLRCSAAPDGPLGLSALDPAPFAFAFDLPLPFAFGATCAADGAETFETIVEAVSYTHLRAHETEADL